MKINKFIKWQLKKWAPFILVVLILLMSSSFINALNRSYSYFDHTGGTPGFYLSKNYNTGLLDIFVGFTILAFTFPFFVFNYRFNKNAADAYNAFPQKTNQIKTLKIILGAAVILALLIFIYWGNFLISLYKYSITPQKQELVSGGTRIRFDINFSNYVIPFFFILISIEATYLANCLFVSLGNSINTSSAYLTLSNFILIFFFFSLMIWVKEEIDSFKYFGGSIGEGMYLEFMLDPLITNKEIDDSYSYALTLIVFFGIVIKCAIGSLAFLMKEPSGEYFGLPGATKKWHKGILYFAFFVLILLTTRIDGGFSEFTLLALIFEFSAFYITLIIFNKSFKIQIEDIIAFAVLFVLFIFLSISGYNLVR